MDGTYDKDEEGTELSDIQAARTQAVVYAGETLRDYPEMVWDDGDMRIEVTDANYLILFTIVIGMVEAPASS